MTFGKVKAVGELENCHVQRNRQSIVYLINIVDDDRSDSNDLGRARRHDSHENEEQNGVFTGGSQKLLSDQWSGKSTGDIVIG